MNKNPFKADLSPVNIPTVVGPHTCWVCETMPEAEGLADKFNEIWNMSVSEDEGISKDVPIPEYYTLGDMPDVKNPRV